MNPLVRYPVSCAVYAEGENRALYLTPAELGPLASSLALPGEDLALLLDASPGLSAPRALAWSALLDIEGEADLVHLPARTSLEEPALGQLPVPLLACAAEAVPVELGSRVAISVADGCHGAVITRDEAVLRRCLTGFLTGYLRAILGPGPALPPIGDELLRPLLAPQPPDTCYLLEFRPRRRYWTLDARSPSGAARHRWVCEAESGRWRAWTWEEARLPGS